MAVVADEERAELLGNDLVPMPESQGSCQRTFGDPGTFLIDICASIPFYWFWFFAIVPDKIFYPCMWAFIGMMVVWRIFRVYTMVGEEGEVDVPYTCGIVKSNGKTMFMVATIHISPRSPQDVEDVIGSCSPDTVMIELDDERLDRMRTSDAPKPKAPKQEDLQAIQISQQGKDTSTIYAQRALWNAERAGETISGGLAWDGENNFGLKPYGGNVQGKLCLVQRGGPEGEFAPFAYKAHIAARSGAEAVLIVSSDDNLPLTRIGGGTFMGDVKVAMKSGTCGFPDIPGLLLTQTDGQQLMKAVEEGAFVNAELKVREDHYPRRTLRRRLCQGFALLFSGIGILYGIIQCFAVEVGGEFLAAEIAAHAKGIPCACIDSNLNEFWSRLGKALIPTPCNIIDAMLAWMAFPRIAFQALFPPRTNVDVMGSIVLHAKSFSFRTWFAFGLAGFAASFVTSHVLALFSNGAERVVESTGAVSSEDRGMAQTYAALLLQLYMLPRIYAAVAASRDEVMYQSVCSKGRENASSRMVVVVGAGHANGIMQRARTRGL